MDLLALLRKSGMDGDACVRHSSWRRCRFPTEVSASGAHGRISAYVTAGTAPARGIRVGIWSFAYRQGATSRVCLTAASKREGAGPEACVPGVRLRVRLYLKARARVANKQLTVWWTASSSLTDLAHVLLYGWTRFEPVRERVVNVPRAWLKTAVNTEGRRRSWLDVGTSDGAFWLGASVRAGIVV